MRTYLIFNGHETDNGRPETMMVAAKDRAAAARLVRNTTWASKVDENWLSLRFEDFGAAQGEPRVVSIANVKLGTWTTRA